MYSSDISLVYFVGLYINGHPPPGDFDLHLIKNIDIITMDNTIP